MSKWSPLTHVRTLEAAFKVPEAREVDRRKRLKVIVLEDGVGSDGKVGSEVVESSGSVGVGPNVGEIGQPRLGR